MKRRYAFAFAIDALRFKKNKKKIFFLHIPKCGGISLRNAIAATYGITEVLRPNALVFLDAASAGYAAMKTGSDVYEFRDVLLAYYMANPRSRFISGHFPLYGAALGEIGKQWNSLTILRNPYKKWISSYYYNRYFENPERVWRDGGASYVARIESEIHDFISSEQSIGFGCEFVTQVVRCNKVDDAYRDDAIREAINRIESLALVGLLEFLPQFKREFQQKFGVSLSISHANQSPAKGSNRASITANEKKKILEVCEPNMRVYAHFAKRYGVANVAE